MNYLLYDCEIIRCIPPSDGQFNPTLEYCAGWRDFGNMGISVIGAATAHGEPEAYLSVEDFMKPLEVAIAQDLPTVGFNSIGFDDCLLRANNLIIKTDYDLLLEIRMAAFGSYAWQDQPKGYSYSLDSIARANGLAKTGKGDLAPVLWQRGEKQAVIDYCLNDVRITRALLELGLAGNLIDPNTGERLKLKPLPF